MLSEEQGYLLKKAHVIKEMSERSRMSEDGSDKVEWLMPIALTCQAFDAKPDTPLAPDYNTPDLPHTLSFYLV